MLEQRTLLNGSGDSLDVHAGEIQVHYDEVIISQPPAEDGTLAIGGAAVDGGASVAALNPLASIPSLSSNAGAPATLYLDFDGHFDATWGSFTNVTTPAFDRDGDAATFSDAELATIHEIWQRVAEDFAPFNINVTTVDPGDFSNGVALRAAIGGDGSWIGPYGGVAYVNTFTNSIVNTVYVFSVNLANGYAKYVADATSHESGHGFGLEHQSEYDAQGTLLREYYAGDGVLAPIMGNSYSTPQSVWFYGTSTAATTFQDDLAVIAGPANGFGYRPDDHGNAIATATNIAVSNGNFSGLGVINSNSDADYFSFSTGAGMISVAVDVAVGANLDVELELRSVGGSLIASADPSDTLGATISASVGAGTYVLVVRSDGSYGEVGQYTMTGTVAAGTFTGGLYRDGQWYLDGDGLGGIAEQAVFFGIPGDMPVVGDWNGDGTDDLGIVRSGHWHFDLDGAGGSGEASMRFGLGSDVPVVGDWNGDGIDDVGVFRNGTWYLDAAGNDGIAETALAFGLSGDTPIVGDWNGDGLDNIGVFRSGTWYFDLDGAGFASERTLFFGVGGDVPVVGDWTGDGTDDIAVFRSGRWFLDTDAAGAMAERMIAFGVSGDRPVSGLWAEPPSAPAQPAIALLDALALPTTGPALAPAMSLTADEAGMALRIHFSVFSPDAAHDISTPGRTHIVDVYSNPAAHISTESALISLPAATLPSAATVQTDGAVGSTFDLALSDLFDELPQLLVQSPR